MICICIVFCDVQTKKIDSILYLNLNFQVQRCICFFICIYICVCPFCICVSLYFNVYHLLYLYLHLQIQRCNVFVFEYDFFGISLSFSFVFAFFVFEFLSSFVSVFAFAGEASQCITCQRKTNGCIACTHLSDWWWWWWWLMWNKFWFIKLFSYSSTLKFSSFVSDFCIWKHMFHFISCFLNFRLIFPFNNNLI